MNVRMSVCLSVCLSVCMYVTYGSMPELGLDDYQYNSRYVGRIRPYGYGFEHDTILEVIQAPMAVPFG